MSAAEAHVVTVGRFRVTHSDGSPFACIAGEFHQEQLDVAGWRSRATFYRALAARRGGRFAAFYRDSIAAAETAIRMLESDGAEAEAGAGV